MRRRMRRRRRRRTARARRRKRSGVEWTPSRGDITKTNENRHHSEDEVQAEDVEEERNPHHQSSHTPRPTRVAAHS
eukprot:7431474-Pyramimonas_sp.AAC.1